YIFCYSPIQNPDDRFLKNAIQIAKAENKRLVIFPGKNMLHREYHEKKYLCPLDFLNLIYYSNKVLTDSFHALCFSIIFEKDFYAFSRKTNPTKIIEILELFNLKQRYVGNNYKPLEKIDYNQVNGILTKL